MYIESIKIEGYRTFQSEQIYFNDGVNVIIGHNNAGKTNLLKALSLILNNGGVKKLEIDDFHKNVSLQDLKSIPPKVSVSISISQSQNEDLNSDDLATVASWLIELKEPYKALLTYEFFLPEHDVDNYRNELDNVTNINEAWKAIKHDFLRKYVHKIYGGKKELKMVAESEYLQKFDFQFLDAIRDVERDMFSGKSILLKEILDFFIDYEIKIDNNKEKDEKDRDIKLRKTLFAAETSKLITLLKGRMNEGKNRILSYAKNTGASFNNATPDFDGYISEVDLYSTLRLIIKQTTQIDIEVPITHNGLGYNNLIFMSLLLAKMQVDTDGDYLGSNAKVFPVLVIEEPEAHLHPAMQHKFLAFLQENIKDKARQIFITTHSTHITSAVTLNELICLNNNQSTLNIGYPGKVFLEDESGKKLKAHVQRFLDATKASMLFAQKVILVEGLAEQILMSLFARYLGDIYNLEDNHIVVVNIGSRYFDPFLTLFDSNKPNTIHKKVACITDRDPERRLLRSKSYIACYPFEYELDEDKYEYREHASGKLTEYSSHPNIRFFSQDPKGKTLEYDLARFNSTWDKLITPSMSNRDELVTLMNKYNAGAEIETLLELLRSSGENDGIIKAFRETNALFWPNTDKCRAIIASRYLNSVNKGLNALELSSVLLDDLEKPPTEREFIVPKYIEEAIKWICQP